jgi:DNA-binding SARP family transcriptional activator/KaiC/GvpD/RAD55 family RecA-like ATPase
MRPARLELWRLNVLGPVELCYEGAPVQIVGVARDLLALLARTPGQEVSTAGIIANLWGTQPPEDAQNVVASQVSRLRKALTAVAPEVDPTGVVVTMPTGYILHIGASNVDAETFERLLADGRRALAIGQPELAITRLEAGLRLWRGEAYSDFGDQPFTRAEALRLEDLRLAAIESTVEARLAIAAPGVPPDLIADVQDLLAQHWHRERLWVHLMTALFRLGRRGDALAALREAEGRLVADLTIEPGMELRSAERAVITSDPSLYGVPLRPSTPPVALTATAPACVGREQEAEWLLAALDMAATRRAQARLIVGSPGIGKTRLLAEVAQRAAGRGIAIQYGAGTGVRDALLVEHDRLNLILLDDLDLASTEDVAEVVRFIRSHVDRPVLTIPTCRDPVRVGELTGLPKLVLAGLGDAAVSEIVRVYAPNTTDAAAVAAMVNTGAVPARLHRAASEWAFARAGRRIDRAAAAMAEPTRWLAAVREEVVAGVLELDHVRRSARPLRPAARVSVGSPYRGLARYEFDDAELFRGRERAVADVLSRLLSAPLVAIVGPAGTGKSSLVRAGVMPAVTSGVLPDSGRWRQLLVTPSSAGELALRLSEVDEEPVVDEPTSELMALAGVADFDSTPDPELGGEAESFEAEFVESAKDPSPAAGLAGARSSRELKPVEPEPEPEPEPVAREPAPVRTLLVVDQFEEAFTLIPAARAELFATLVDAAASGEVTVLLVVRSDAYPRSAESPELARLVTANTLMLAPMTPDELRRAIEEPAVLAGGRVEPALVATLVADAAEAGLPALSAGLATLWAQRVDGELRLDAYRGAGGLARAVEQLGERAYATLTPEQRDEAAQVLARTVDAPIPEHEVGLHVLAVLRTYGLIGVLDGQVRLVHESLPARWPRLRGWLAERDAQRELRTHLASSARAWVEGGRDGETLYGGARLAAALEHAAEHDVSTGEREFLAAGQRVRFAADQRRRQQVSRLWYAIIVLSLVLATAVAAGVMVFIAWQDAAAANQRADAVQLAQRGPTEPDLRLGLRLAATGVALDGSAPTTDALRATLLRSPDLMATAGDGVTAIAVSPDGASVAAAAGDGLVWLFHAGSLAPLFRLDGAVRGLAFTPDAHRLVGWGGPAGVVVWDVSSGQQVGSPFGQPGPAESGPASGGLLADGDTLLLATDGAPIAWSLSARTPSTAYTLPTGPAAAVVVAPDGSAVAFDDAAAGTTIVTVPSGHTTQLAGATHPVALSPGGRTLLTTSGVWDVTAHSHTELAGPVVTAAWSADGSTFATGAADGTMVVYDAATRAPTRTLVGDRLAVRTLHFGLDGRTLYSATGSGALMAWDLTGTRGVGSSLAQNETALIPLACHLAGRDLTPAEWAVDVPDFPYRRVCP